MKRTLAVDVRMAEHSGIGVYLRHTLGRLAVLRPHWQFRLFGPKDSFQAIEPRPNYEFRDLDTAIYSLREQIMWPPRLLRGVDALWVPHYNIPLLAPVPICVTVHDVAHLAAPSATGGLHRRLYARLLFSAVRHRAAAVFFVSDFSRAEFSRLIGAPRGATYLTPNAAAPIWSDAAARSGPRPYPGRYLIFVGNIKPHKNIRRLVEAFEIVASRDVDLVLVGRKDGFRLGETGLGDLIAKLGPRVHFTGPVSDAELVLWTAHAAALVLPSLYEGFGIPPLEAMTVGCPTIVSDIPPLHEVCGTATEYVDPYDVGDIARGISRVLDDADRAEHLRTVGRPRAELFSYDIAAGVLAEGLEKVMASR